jgi:hypothetical protein
MIASRTTVGQDTRCVCHIDSGRAAASPDASGQGKYIDVAARGKDGALWLRGYDVGTNLWSGWRSLGGKVASGTAPACVWSGGVGRFDFLVTGTNRAMYHKWYNGAWSGWQDVGGYLTSSPAAMGIGGGATDVTVRGGDGGFWYTDNGPSGGSWLSWMPFCVGP